MRKLFLGRRPAMLGDAARTTRSGSRSDAQAAAAPPQPPPATAIMSGEYVDVLTLEVWKLGAGCNTKAPTLSITNDRVVSLGIEDEKLREEFKSQGAVYKRLGGKLLMDPRTQETVLWNGERARRVQLPNELYRRHGKTQVKELVEPMSRSRYLLAPGVIVPTALRDSTVSSNPNHVAAASVLRQVRPQMVLFVEPAENRLHYLRTSDGRLVDLRDDAAGGVVIGNEVLLLSTPLETAMSPARVAPCRSRTRRRNV